MNDGRYCAFYNAQKHKEYNFLSNFEMHTMQTPLGVFKCSQSYYQYLKFKHTNNGALHNVFINATPQEAYETSRREQSRCDPNFKKEEAMMETLQLKFSDKHMRDMLLSTGSAFLVENCPLGKDSYWGDNGDGSGSNRLGILLMTVRGDLGGTGVVPRPSILDEFYSKKCSTPGCTRPCHFGNNGTVLTVCDVHRFEKLTLGNYSTSIEPTPMTIGTGRFMYFNMNDMDDLVEEAARLIAGRIHSLNLPNPFFVAPATSTIALAHVLKTKYSIKGVVLSKSKSPGTGVVYSVEYCTFTSLDKKMLYLPDSVDLYNKDIFIVDNVTTTGETIRAVYKLLCMARVDTKRVVEALVLFTERSEVKQLEILPRISLNVTSFGHLPLLPCDASVDSMQYKLYSSSTLPTQFGTVKFCVFRHRVINVEAIAVVSQSIADEPLIKHSRVPVRVHDACITSEAFHSVKCDCKLQLDKALTYFAKNGGIVIYLNQEGRGIGLGNKIAAYNLQQTKNLDTVEANRALGLPDDLREYVAARDILNQLNVTSVLLMTNNPRKVTCLESLGVKIEGTIPCVVDPESTQMLKYMSDKARLMHHNIDIESLHK